MVSVIRYHSNSSRSVTTANGYRMSHKMGAGEERASFIYQGANVGGHGNLSTVVKPPRPRYRHVYMRTTFLYVLFFYLVSTVFTSVYAVLTEPYNNI